MVFLRAPLRGLAPPCALVPRAAGPAMDFGEFFRSSGDSFRSPGSSVTKKGFVGFWFLLVGLFLVWIVVVGSLI